LYGELADPNEVKTFDNRRNAGQADRDPKGGVALFKSEVSTSSRKHKLYSAGRADRLQHCWLVRRNPSTRNSLQLCGTSYRWFNTVAAGRLQCVQIRRATTLHRLLLHSDPRNETPGAGYLFSM